MSEEINTGSEGISDSELYTRKQGKDRKPAR